MKYKYEISINHKLTTLKEASYPNCDLFLFCVGGYTWAYTGSKSVFKLLSVKSAGIADILVFDKDLKEYYSMEYYDLEAEVKELNYLCELVPVRFDSDSLTFTQKSPVRYEISLNFKEIIKE